VNEMWGKGHVGVKNHLRKNHPGKNMVLGRKRGAERKGSAPQNNEKKKIGAGCSNFLPSSEEGELQKKKKPARRDGDKYRYRCAQIR